MTQPDKIRVLIADDSTSMRNMLTAVLLPQDDMELLPAAKDGEMAVTFCRDFKPDVLVLDVEMPKLDGIEVLKILRHEAPAVRTILLSSLTQRFAPITVQGLSLGAVGYIPKPSALQEGLSLDEVAAKLLDLIRSVASSSEKKRYSALSTVPRLPQMKPDLEPDEMHPVQFVAIASSTGGPNALSRLFKSVNGIWPAPALIVQHMPKIFLPQLAERLSMESGVPFEMADHEKPVKKGIVYVAPGEIHTKIEAGSDANPRFMLVDSPPEQFCKPSANPSFRSAAQVYRRGTLAVVLTGMGSDGMHGANLVKHYGGTVAVQDKDSSVVWGMPGAVAEAGLADFILPLEDMGGWLRKRMALEAL